MSVTIVAELGVNHNGSVDTALAMVQAAAQAGADAVKVQHFSASEFCTPAAMYQGERQVDMFRRYELPLSDLARIAEECRCVGVKFFGTPDSVQHGRELVELGAEWIKVGSDDITNLPLIRGLAELGKPMILSTGMASREEISRAAVCLPDMILLHCVSRYPTTESDANLARMSALAMWDGWDDIGYSDHTDGIEAAVLAVALDAVMVEKHFTLNRDQPGPDHAFSADPLQFAEMVRRIRQAEVLLGDGAIDPGPEELEMRKVARRSIVAAWPIEKGDEIREQYLAFKRPGTGLMPGRADEIIGRKATRYLAPDEQLREGDWS